jgi:hypothetical protein
MPMSGHVTWACVVDGSHQTGGIRSLSLMVYVSRG